MAVIRAGFERPHSAAGDPDAQRRLTASMGSPAVTSVWLRTSLAARTRFFDEQVVTALEGGTRQVVIVGAGYDDRALRFRSEGVRYFEIDHPVAQADKRERLLEITKGEGGPALVAADFRTDDVGVLLGAAAHDPSEATLYLCEGLLVYLDQPTIVRLLRSLRDRASPRSVLAASLALHQDGLGSAQVLETANARRRTGATEPFRTILPQSAQIELFARGGWQVTRTVDVAGLEPEAQRGRSLLVTADPAGP